MRVERRGRLVEDQDRRVLEQRARDAEALALAARQRGARLRPPACRSPAAGAATNVMDVRGARRRLDLLVATRRAGRSGCCRRSCRRTAPAPAARARSARAATAARSARRRRRRSSTRPPVGSKNRGIRLASVVLPAPVRPTSATISPGRASKLTSSRIGAVLVVGEADVLEADVAGDARRRRRPPGASSGSGVSARISRTRRALTIACCSEPVVWAIDDSGLYTAAR